jgi:hypothetical protein
MCILGIETYFIYLKWFGTYEVKTKFELAATFL